MKLIFRRPVSTRTLFSNYKHSILDKKFDYGFKETNLITNKIITRQPTKASLLPISQKQSVFAVPDELKNLYNANYIFVTKNGQIHAGTENFLKNSSELPIFTTNMKTKSSFEKICCQNFKSFELSVHDFKSSTGYTGTKTKKYNKKLLKIEKTFACCRPKMQVSNVNYNQIYGEITRNCSIFPKFKIYQNSERQASIFVVGPENFEDLRKFYFSCLFKKSQERDIDENYPTTFKILDSHHNFIGEIIPYPSGNGVCFRKLKDQKFKSVIRVNKELESRLVLLILGSPLAFLGHPGSNSINSATLL